MGAGGSVQTEAVKAQLLPFFVEEYSRIQSMGLEGDALAHEFQQALAARIPDLEGQVLVESSVSGKQVGISTSSKGLPERCHKTLHHIVDRHSLTMLVCVDGSPASDLSFDVAMRMRKSRDKILIYHSFNLSEQASLNVHFQRDSIASKYTSMAMMNGVSANEADKIMLLRERADGEDNKDSVLSLIAEYDEELHGMPIGQSYYLPTKNVDFIVVGFTGSRGAEKAASGPTVMGSTTNLTLRGISRPIVVAKAPLPPLGENGSSTSLLYVVAVDSSERSKKGLALIMTLVKPKDRVVCVHIAADTEGFQGDHGESDSKELEKFYRTELDLFGPAQSSLIKIPQANGKTRAQMIVEYVNDTCEPRPDFLCISPRARVSQHEELGSVSDGIVMDAKCNIIFCKSV